MIFDCGQCNKLSENNFFQGPIQPDFITLFSLLASPDQNTVYECTSTLANWPCNTLLKDKKIGCSSFFVGGRIEIASLYIYSLEC